MTAQPEQLHALLIYCIDFAKRMLDDSQAFYPFGAKLSCSGQIEPCGAWDGNDRPEPVALYKLLEGAFRSEATSGNIVGAALAVNVNIPQQYASPSRDGLRVKLESSNYSRYVYVPYMLSQDQQLSTKKTTHFYEPFAVEAAPAFFVAKDIGTN